jgi:hypothetical protein
MVVMQMRFHVQFSLSAWIIASLASAACFVPVLFWYSKRYQETVAASLLAMAAQFAIAMTVLMPVVAKPFSSVELANYFNRTGNVPSRVLLAEERVSSVIFYLKPELRSKLKAENFKRVFVEELALEIDPSTLLIIPERKVEKMESFISLRGIPYQTVGRHRIYEPGTITPEIAYIPDAMIKLR